MTPQREKAIFTEVTRTHAKLHRMTNHLPSLAYVRDEWCDLYEMVTGVKCQ
jgi:hypothetical protein